LGKEYSGEKIVDILSIVPSEMLVKVGISKKQTEESVKMANMLKIPRKDILHAILARDSYAIMITRDRHFEGLQGMVNVKKPEELI